jgi:peroxin-5
VFREKGGMGDSSRPNLLKELVTGEDSCAGGASGSGRNALSSFADAVFGGGARYSEHVGQAVPGQLGSVPGGQGQSAHSQSEKALAHAMGGSSSLVDQLPNESGQGFSVTEFLQSTGRGQRHQEQEMFDRVFDMSAGGHTTSPSVNQSGPIFHAFLHNNPVGSAPVNNGPLNVREKCHVRDRSTILARQLFIDKGEEYVARHVDGLMRSLHIDPSSLPVSPPQQEQWNGIYSSYAGTRVAADHAAGVSSASGKDAGDTAWTEEFSKKMNVSDAWAADFENHASGSQWANEFTSERKQGLAGVDLDPALNSVSALEHTRKLADTLSAETDPKFKHSKFLQFVSKMSRGEIIVDGNAVKEVPKASVHWADEFQGSLLDNYFDSKSGGTDWAAEFADNIGSEWVDEFSRDHNAGFDWAENYLKTIDEAARMGQEGYRMTENNPFLTDTDSFTKGRHLFQQGLLSEAVLAVEAECQRNPGNADAWKLLGTIQAENDDDIQAIAAMNRALACDPNNPEVLLSLGVSYTNEFDQKSAILYLRQWLGIHPNYKVLVQNDVGPPDSSQNLTHTINLFKNAAQIGRNDADVYVALGVLYNLARQFENAVSALRQALTLNSNDYSLWNKLGATLANSAHSGEALDAYRRALELKPNYMRAWTNMGISLANLGEYEDSAKYYVRALTLNDKSNLVWGYLRTSLICGARDDLLGYADSNDLQALQQALPL